MRIETNYQAKTSKSYPNTPDSKLHIQIQHSAEVRPPASAAAVRSLRSSRGVRADCSLAAVTVAAAAPTARVGAETTEHSGTAAAAAVGTAVAAALVDAAAAAVCAANRRGHLSL